MRGAISRRRRITSEQVRCWKVKQFSQAYIHQPVVAASAVSSRFLATCAVCISSWLDRDEPIERNGSLGGAVARFEESSYGDPNFLIHLSKLTSRS